MACFICLGAVNSCCGELKYANFSEVIIHDPSLVSRRARGNMLA